METNSAHAMNCCDHESVIPLKRIFCLHAQRDRKIDRINYGESPLHFQDGEFERTTCRSTPTASSCVISFLSSSKVKNVPSRIQLFGQLSEFSV